MWQAADGERWRVSKTAKAFQASADGHCLEKSKGIAGSNSLVALHNAMFGVLGYAGRAATTLAPDTKATLVPTPDPLPTERIDLGRLSFGVDCVVQRCQIMKFQISNKIAITSCRRCHAPKAGRHVAHACRALEARRPIAARLPANGNESVPIFRYGRFPSSPSIQWSRQERQKVLFIVDWLARFNRARFYYSAVALTLC